ncbi:Protein DAMAGED DNA-BINDING 2 [Hordeum vulgare]|nr:Protein DAMAGED DNA-BINDING 2 [Hordeum vulgare]
MMGNWDYVKLHEKITYDSVHSCILNSMKFDTANDGVLYTASSDGTISSTDLDTGIGSPLLNLNPDGWSGPSTLRMIYGMDLNTEKAPFETVDLDANMVYSCITLGNSIPNGVISDEFLFSFEFKI